MTFHLYLIYLGDDTFTLVNNDILLGAKISEPCGFFLYCPTSDFRRFKLNGIGNFLKEKGAIDEV